MVMPCCAVCHTQEAAGVFSSSLGPVSFAYCSACATEGLEPYPAVVGGLFGLKGLDELNAEMVPRIKASRVKAGKTEEELWADVRKLEDDYWREANVGACG